MDKISTSSIEVRRWFWVLTEVNYVFGVFGSTATFVKGRMVDRSSARAFTFGRGTGFKLMVRRQFHF